MSNPPPSTAHAASGALKPRALKSGARVALVAPAGPLKPERIDASIERCRSLELEPVLFPFASARHRFLAGSDADRLGDLQRAFDDPAIDAVWALRGGYGTLRILDRLDLSRQLRDPIPFIGFSDNSSLHALHAELGVISFHGPHPGAEFPPETEDAFRRVLFDASPPGALPTRSFDPDPQGLVPGRVAAPLVGGNLSTLAAMCGAPHAVQARGRILLLEDIGEAAYRIDRLLLQLERSGTLEGVAGLALGRFTDTPDQDTHPALDALAELATRLGVPTVADLPFGHIEHNWTLPIGAMAELDGDAGTLTLLEAAVTSRLPQPA